MESRREVVKGAVLFVLTTHGKMGIYSKAVTKNKTVDVLVNERESTRGRRECLSQDTCV